ncbi:MAG: cupredoxin domain-containing protein [Proteobacteria bacterium]|nr:cupredoxin domain-containing protein [Pseudomonadota bacterium]
MKRAFLAFLAGPTLLWAVPALAGEHVVRMAGMAYAPAAIGAKLGDTIRFVNDDGTAHNVFVPTVGFGVDLGKQDPGKEATLVLAKAGRFEVECVFHPDMRIAVAVSR